MHMRSLRDIVFQYAAEGRVLWHFNFSDLTTFRAASRLAQETGTPIILGTSEGERKAVGIHEAVALVMSARTRGIPLYLNADHTKSLEAVQAAVGVGYNAVIFDGSALPLAENITQTKRVVEFVRMMGFRALIEGELGYIGTSSEMLDKVPEGVQMASMEDAIRFVRETGVDMFAPAVGNIHGMLKSGREPKLDIGLIRKIKDAVRIPLVLHGASGNTDAELKEAIKAGITIIHVSTEIRVAWRDALRGSLEAMPNEVAPYKLLEKSEEAAYALMKAKLAISR